MACRKDEAFSITLSRALDMIGLSITDVKKAQLSYDLLNHKLNELVQLEGYSLIIAGSTREGVSIFDNSSDVDIMVTPSPMVSPLGYYKLRFSNSPPGYIQLQIFDQVEVNQAVFCTISKRTYATSISCSAANHEKDRRVHGPCIIYNSTISAKDIGLHLLPSDQQILFAHVRGFSRAGPSLKYQLDNLGMDINSSMDCVLAFPCKVPHYLRLWCNRRRNHSLFPTIYQIQEISQMDAHVVPIGCKKTYNARLDWRICYTLAEIALIRSFNEIQYKVYAILKRLAKSVIKHVCSDITSYVMKNVILWVSELVPISMFEDTNICNCLVMCLHFLRQCIRNRYLPNYMIPDRDLLFGRLLNSKRVRALNRLLGDMISEGGEMVLRCERLRIGMYVLMKAPVLSEVTKAINLRTLSFVSRVCQDQRLITVNDYCNELLNFVEGEITTSNVWTCCHSLSMIQISKKAMSSHSDNGQLVDINMDVRDIFQRCIHLERQILGRLLDNLHQVSRHQLISNMVQYETNGERNSDSVDRLTSSYLDIIDSSYQNNEFRNIMESLCRQCFGYLVFTSETEQNQIVNRILGYLPNKPFNRHSNT